VEVKPRYLLRAARDSGPILFDRLSEIEVGSIVTARGAIHDDLFPGFPSLPARTTKD